MKATLRIIILSAFLLGIFCSSCGKLYWYRSKVRAERELLPKPTFKIIVNNWAPDYLSNQFERSIRGICVRALSKKGYVESNKDTADFTFIIYLKVDSFEVKTPIYFRNGYTTANKLVTPNPTATYTYFNRFRLAKEISFDYNFIYNKLNVSYWTSKSEFYFFGNEMRDLRRSKSMINYTIRTSSAQ